MLMCSVMMRLRHLLLVAPLSLAMIAVSCADPGAYNPAKCVTTANDPHPSGHVPGKINAEIRQKCPLSVSDISAEAQLWEDRFWGWDKIGSPGFAGPKTGSQISAFAHADCRDNDIRVTGYGHYSWNGAHVQSVEVSKTKHVDC